MDTRKLSFRLLSALISTVTRKLSFRLLSALILAADGSLLVCDTDAHLVRWRIQTGAH